PPPWPPLSSHAPRPGPSLGPPPPRKGALFDDCCCSAPRPAADLDRPGAHRGRGGAAVRGPRAAGRPGTGRLPRLHRHPGPGSSPHLAVGAGPDRWPGRARLGLDPVVVASTTAVGPVLGDGVARRGPGP